MELALILEAMMNRPVQTDLGMEVMVAQEDLVLVMISKIRAEVPTEVMGKVILPGVGLVQEARAKEQPLGSLGNLLEICIPGVVVAGRNIQWEPAALEVAGILEQMILPQLLGPQIQAVVEVVAEVMDITILLLVGEQVL